MASTNIQVRSGNRIIILFDGVDVGCLASVIPADDYGLDPASGIGDAHVIEYVPGMARHTINVSQMVLYQTNMRSAGVAVENADDALKGRVFDIEILDKPNGQVVTAYRSCSYGSGSTEIRKHAIVMASGTFMALDRQGTAM